MTPKAPTDTEVMRLREEIMLYKFEAAHWKAAYEELNLQCTELADLETDLAKCEAQIRALVKQ